jgi:hypothetical protein
MDQVRLAIKQSKLVILCISDEFTKDERCLQLFELLKNILENSYLLVEFGHMGAHKLLEYTTFASVCTDIRVIMQDPNRYPVKLAEMFEAIELHDTKIEKSLKQKPSGVFISYCWQNSHDAIKKGTRGPKTALGWLDPRTLVSFFKENGIDAWIDIQELNTSTTLFAEITKRINTASLAVACLSDEYANSTNCKVIPIQKSSISKCKIIKYKFYQSSWSFVLLTHLCVCRSSRQ